MSRYENLMRRLSDGEVVVIDGGTGTECELRGVPMLENAWNGGAALSHPQIVEEIHRDYLAAGAQLIITNTFGTSYHTLRDAGVEHDFEAYNRRAGEIAVSARSDHPNAVVAGGISNWSFTDSPPPPDSMRARTTEQAAALRAGGCDVIVLEMMSEIDVMRATIEGSLEVDHPLWVGLSIGSELGERVGGTDQVRLRKGEPLVDALAALENYPVNALFIMHTDVELVAEALNVVRNGYSGPIGVYAHSGSSGNSSWQEADVISPEDYLVYAQQWVDQGAQIVGGCCGTAPAHIEALRGLV